MSQPATQIVGSVVLGAGLVLLAWLIWRTDWTVVLQTLAAADWRFVLLIAIPIICEQALRAVKWRRLLLPFKPISAISIFNAIMAGFAAGVLIPIGVSPFVRSWLLARRFDLAMMTVLTTATIDRMVDAAVFLAFACLALLLFQLPSTEPGLVQQLLLVIGISSVVLTLVVISLRWYRHNLTKQDSRLQQVLAWFPQRFLAVLAPMSENIAAGVGFPAFRDGGFVIVGCTVLMRCLSLWLFVFGGLALGITFTLAEYFFLIVIPGFAYVLARLLRMPGGFVVGGVFALTLLGQPEETAVAIMMLIHVTTAAVVCLIGLPVLLVQGISFTDLRTAGRH